MSIKDNIKKQMKTLPGIRKLVVKNELLENQLCEARYNSVKIGQKLVDYRLKLKAINNEKINVVFVCHRPAVWESLHSVYDALNEDDSFNVSIVAIPNKKELPESGLNHEVYESEGAEDFWKEYGCINGYNYETKEWLDLRQLEPDYVFFQQPYNLTRSEGYKSWNVGQYAKICYLNYFSPVSFGEIYDECTPEDFIRDISFYFTQNPKDHEYMLNRYKTLGYNSTTCIMTGYPRYDRLKNVKKESDIWNDKLHGKFRLVWTPRWTTNEGNCHFFEYKDRLIEFCLKNNVELVFRPHPQAFLEWISTGEFTQDEQNALRKKFEENDNLHLDERMEYLSLFYSSDCLLTDPSSVVYDYFLTGKPVIFSKGVDHNDFELLKGGLYEESEYDKVEDVLKKIIAGEDVLFDVRSRIMDSAYYINDKGAGNSIREILKANNKEGNIHG